MKKAYVDFKIGKVIKIRNKYGFRIVLVYADGTNQRKQVGGFKKKTDAEIRRNQVIAELYSGKYVLDDILTVEEYFVMWLNEVMKPRIKASTYTTYYYNLNNHILPRLGGIAVSKLHRGHIVKLYQTVSEHSVYSAKTSRVILKTALKYAEQNNIIAQNPAENIQIPKAKHSGKGYHTVNIDSEVTLSVDQLNLLIQRSKGTTMYLPILFAGLLGLRKSEILGLKYSDVDYLNRTIHIQRQLGRDLNKDNIKPKTATKQEISLKTRSSDRIIYLPNLVYNSIMEERQQYENNKRRKPNQFQDLNYICCSTYGRPRSASFVYKPFKKLLKESNLPDIRFHDLRHTYATILMKDEISLKAISSSLGHAKTIISVDVYGDMKKIIEDSSSYMDSFIAEILPEEAFSEKPIINVFTDKYSFLSTTLLKRMLGEKLYGFLLVK